MRVSVVYCSDAERQTVIELEVADGVTVAQAILASRVLTAHPELDPEKLLTGVFGERVTPNAVLQEGDRVELYRPLKADPKSARRKRASARRARR